MTTLPPKVSYISWAAYCSRSDHTARELGGASHMIYRASLGSRLSTVWLKYLIQTVSTWRVLRQDRSAAVFVMAPPVFAVVAVFAYCLVTRTPFVIDTHTAAILHPRWKRLQWLHHMLCRRAATNIVTNQHLADVVEGAGGHATIVPDVPIVFPEGGRFSRDTRFTIAVVCSFNYDEPIEAMIEASAQLGDVRFFMTGNPRDLDRRLAARLPANVMLTGFLPDADYGALLTHADAVMTLTTRDHTMLRGAYEAIYQGTPVIVSDFALLRASFDSGALHVDNSAAQIVAAVREMQRAHPEFQAGAAALRDRKLRAWTGRKAGIAARLGATLPSSAPPLEDRRAL